MQVIFSLFKKGCSGSFPCWRRMYLPIWIFLLCHSFLSFLEAPCCVTVWHAAVRWELREILAVWELFFLLMYAKTIIAKCIICCNLHIHTQHRSGQSSHKNAVPYFLLLYFDGQKNMRSPGHHCARCCRNALKVIPAPDSLHSQYSCRELGRETVFL